ncbi:MAG TPA: hypothetical protein VMH84_01320 [Xanthobacteraceae bacterium]|nr:hypothetical protein [Xanthobacteraceae bacterium]
MTDKENQDVEAEAKSMRAMWIASAAIVVLIVGAMGINMLVHKDTSAGTVETGIKSEQAPPSQ